MLNSLNISNVAIIDQLEVEFGPGLNLLTGETGAGKSIIIDSLGLALGYRASSELVRTGAKEAKVEAVFAGIKSSEISQIADNVGFTFSGELILRRRLRADGVSKAYINDTQVNVSTLREIGALLVAIHGQGEGDELLGAEGQLALLDAFAGCSEQVDKVSEIFVSLQALEAELSTVSTNERERVREIDLLEHQIREIESARLDPEEEKELLQQRNLLRNAEKLRELSDRAFQTLYAGEDAITGRLAEVVSLVDELSRFDESFREKKGQIEAAGYQLDDAADSLRDFLSRIEADPARLEQIESRLDTIRTLQKKYGDTTEEVLRYLEQAKSRLEGLRGADERAESLRKDLEDLLQIYQREALTLRKAREKAVTNFEKAVMKHLSELALEKAVFSVSLEPHPRGRTRSGVDRVSFLISPNPGEALKPLAKIASGGEMSRLMLAIKSCAVEPRSHFTAIFDEVDAGIGGRVAEFIGRKLKRLSAAQQVICITHLPQIAVYSQHHSTVIKQALEGRTLVDLKPLSGKDQIEELARMLGGEEITDVTRRHARELLSQARNYPQGN